MLASRWSGGRRFDLCGIEIGEEGGEDAAEHARPEKIGVGQEQSERQNAKYGSPDDVFAADFVAHGAADDGAGSDGAEKNEKVELSALNGHVKFGHQIKRVIAHQTGQVEKL